MTPETAWEPAHDLDESEVGALYRLRCEVRADYSVNNITRLEQALRYGEGVNNTAAWLGMREKIEILSFQAHYPKNTMGGAPTWEFTCTFKKTATGTPLAVIVGLVALVVSVSIFAAVVGHTIEKEGSKIGGLVDKTADAAKATLFNPFFIIAAVIVVLAVKGRTLKSIGG